MEKLSFWDRLFLGGPATTKTLDEATDEINRHHMDISALHDQVQELRKNAGSIDKVVQTQAREILHLKAIVQVLTEALLESKTIAKEALEENIQRRITALQAPPDPLPNAAPLRARARRRR